jgi:hypothetical protein
MDVVYTIHACQKLCDDTTLHFTLSTLSLGGNGINFINEKEAWCDSLEKMNTKLNNCAHKRTLASSNVSRSVFSDSPDMPETMDGAEMLMKGTPSSYID